jgi:hypothetical protein
LEDILKESISMQESRNGIEHKCPCCGYEVKWDWNANNKEGDFVKGDESFIQIKNDVGGTIAFRTDKPRDADYRDYQTTYLLGCPKCGCVSCRFW